MNSAVARRPTPTATAPIEMSPHSQTQSSALESDPDAESMDDDVEPSPTVTMAPLGVIKANSISTRPNFDRGSKARERIIHHWECVVQCIGRDTFQATLRSLLDKEDSEKEAEIPIEDVNADDQELLVEGAVFYWTIHYAISARGTQSRSSVLKFRRLPAWSKRDIERVNARAAELWESFGVSSTSPNDKTG